MIKEWLQSFTIKITYEYIIIIILLHEHDKLSIKMFFEQFLWFNYFSLNSTCGSFHVFQIRLLGILNHEW